MTRELLVRTAMEYIGAPALPYNGAENGMSVWGFDCSGLISFLLKEIGFPKKIPRHANELFDNFGVFIHEEMVKKGDLVFFSNRNRGLVPDYVGIMVSKTQFIHSPGKDGDCVKVSKLTHSLIKASKEAVWEQIYFQNPIGFKRLAISSGRYKQIIA